MQFNGQLSEDEVVEYIALKLKVETIKNVLTSRDFNEQAKLLIIRGLVAETEDK